ncbi:universal stress protein [Haloarchaeobius sp. TZWSO28]|uniref:universal stress protein n=1 Tax=Haloarchaeobius sp. TZWSO28 TaxID=3446119 RepID=UPI003EBA5CC9
MSETVLVPVKNHAPWAETVADAAAAVEDEDTDVVVLHVFDEAEAESTRQNLDDEDTLTLDDLASRKRGVNAAIDVLAEEGLSSRPRGAHEDERTADAILRVAESEDADRLYVYGRKRSPAGKAVFGSTVQRLILNAGVPVTVVPPAG